MSALAGRDRVEYREKSMSGAEYKSHILNSLCSGRWDPTYVVHLAAMFKDVAMATDELGFVVDRIIRMLGEVELQELPPLVYQLLLLTAKVNLCFCLIYLVILLTDPRKKCIK